VVGEKVAGFIHSPLSTPPEVMLFFFPSPFPSMILVTTLIFH
jgi:hypothetical protein